MKIFVSLDGKTERMLDSEVLMHRGSKLQYDAQVALRKAFILINACDSL